MPDLVSMVLPKTLTSIGNGVLDFDMSALASLAIPEGVTKIGYGFANFKRELTSVILPSTLTEIGGDSFLGCENLSVVINHNPNPIDIECVFTCRSFGESKPTLYIPYDSGDLYREANGWGEFDVVELPANISVMPEVHSVLFTWPPVESAEGYILTIYADEERAVIVKVFRFGADGQFVEQLRSDNAEANFAYRVSDLDSGVAYYYTLAALRSETEIFSFQGLFVTSETTSLAETFAGDLLVNGECGFITVAGAQGQSIAVYSSLGNLVFFVTATSDMVRMPVAQPGIYIVKIGTESTKVIVK